MATLSPRSFIFVTGGAGGIGSAVCRLLPSIGITPIIGFNNNAIHAKQLAEELNGFAVKIDLTRSSSIDAAIKSILNEVELNDVLVGVVLGASPPPELEPIRDIAPDHLSHQFKVNVIGSQLLLQGLMKNFFRKKKSGTVIGILTKAIGNDDEGSATGMGAYVVSKIAFKSLLSVWSAEYPWLKVKTVSPGFTKTQMLNVFDPRYLELIEMKNRIFTPDEVAKSIVGKIKL